MNPFASPAQGARDFVPARVGARQQLTRRLEVHVVRDRPGTRAPQYEHPTLAALGHRQQLGDVPIDAAALRTIARSARVDQAATLVIL